MATVSTTRSFDAGIFDRATTAFTSATERFAQYRTFRKTVRELSELSGRELADLGIARSAIHSVAYEATYGA
ncbi:DUF1127 domain-containing protein [Cochlodiniinecator piscidefendens]|uniref:DUF1127 domain-containing protein n=1 Tax=Cochlodiniinecator piscidefendens TaxID=2715756 RepID=UPI00140751EF|nr:DUF1127 domain-containing protein [Cochlodiniinecator piscidefendens]